MKLKYIFKKEYRTILYIRLELIYIKYKRYQRNKKINKIMRK